MIEREESAFATTAFTARALAHLPSISAKRSRLADELQPVGAYAHVNPYYRTVQDVEAVQAHEPEDPEFKNKDWWWDHQRIRFLNEKLGLKFLILVLPITWILILWLSGPFTISWLVAEFITQRAVPELLAFVVLVLGLLLSFAWLAFALWATPVTTNWLMSKGIRWLLQPFENTLNEKLDRSFEDGCSEFNRLTGQVRFALGRKRFFEAPFAEFDAYAERVVQKGGIFYRLMFVHRYTQKTFNQTWLSGIEPSKTEVLALWDMLQRYMDVSEPLPDVPRLEPFRHLDPVTRAYDQKSGRQARYWRDLDLKAWTQNEGARMLKAQCEYPWGQRQCRLTPQLGKVSMAEYRDMRPATAWPI